MIATLVITLFGPYQFSSLAESGIDYVEAALSAIANCADEIAEARADNMDLGSVNDWNTATKVDHLPWNFFHICVQLQICNLYGTGKEKRIYFKQENDRGQ